MFYEKLDTECYICFEPCKTKSPCECKTYVHRKCLDTFLSHTDHSNCTICRRPLIRPLNRWKPAFCILGAVICSYFLMGFIGQILFDWWADTSVRIEPPWTLKHIAGVTTVGFIIFLIAIFVKRACR